MTRCLLVALLAAGCAPSQAKVIRGIGVGLATEGALVAAGAYVTRDPGEDLRDATTVALPLLVTGLAVFLVGNVIGFGSEATPDR